MKKCSKCKNEKPFTDFVKCKVRKDGFYPYCKECKKIENQNYVKKYNDQYKRYCKSWELKNKERRKKQKSLREKTDKCKEYRRTWRQNNKDKTSAYCRNAQAMKINATPKWLTKGQIKEIELFYTHAHIAKKVLKEKFEVDHIVPLKGKTVCGLHVPWNLQILTESENCSKGNRI